MPNFPWRPSGNVPPVGDGALDELLATGQPPQDAVSGLLPVAEVLAALQAGPSGSELAGKARAMAEFRATAGLPHRPRRVLPRRVLPRGPAVLRTGPSPILRARVSSKLAAAAAAAAVVIVGGTAAAAYIGALPGPLQKVAHDAIAAPAASTSAATAARAGAGVGMASTGSVAYGLCTAYRHARVHGSAPERAVAFRNLAKTAGGPGRVTSCCASVAQPGASGKQGAAAAQPSRVKRSAHPAGQRPGHPTRERPGHHTGERSGHPGGNRSGHPGGNRSGHPGGDRSGHPGGDRSGHPGGDRSGHPGGDRSGHASGQRSARPSSHSHREAIRGSAPGTQRPSPFHPSALSGRGRGC